MMEPLNILQFSVTVLNMLAFILTACGCYRFGFLVMMVSQPLWWMIGVQTGLKAAQILAVFYTVASIVGIVRENKSKHVRYGDFTEAVLWFFKIGWKPADDYGCYWNERLKKLKGVNDL